VRQQNSGVVEDFILP